MKVALIGYGRMGKAIESLLLNRGHEVVAKFSRDGIDRNKLVKADVAIEFTRPEVAFENLKTCFELKIPVITGTTGWLDDYNEAVKLCKKHQSAFLYASNFSLGVNIFFEINKKLARLMRPQQGYDVSMEEIHHTQKLDAPSGTAITLAEQIIDQIEEKKAWTLDEPGKEEIKITAKRVEGVPGTHSIQYQSNIDTLEIKHTAHNRQGFALGAVVAAEFIHNQRGVFTMKDVLKLQS